MGIVLENRPHLLPVGLFAPGGHRTIWRDKKHNRHAQRAQRPSEPGIEGQTSVSGNKRASPKKSTHRFDTKFYSCYK